MTSPPTDLHFELLARELVVRLDQPAELRRIAAELVDGGPSRWLGSPDSLALFALAPGAAPNRQAVERVLVGEKADQVPIDKEAGASTPAVRRSHMRVGPSVGHTLVELRVPSAIAALHQRSDERGKDEIDDALLSVAARTLEHVVTTHPVIPRGRLRPEVAGGLAAIGTVGREQVSGEDALRPIVRVALVGVQEVGRERMLQADHRAMVTPDAQRAADDVAVESLMSTLVEKHGYQVSEDGRTIELPPGRANAIGRDEVEIKDPLARYQRMLGPQAADWLGRRADALGGGLRAPRQHQLEERRAELLDTIEPLDPRTAFAVRLRDKRREHLREEGERYAQWGEALTKRLAETAQNGDNQRVRQALAHAANTKVAAVERLRNEWRDLQQIDRELGDAGPDAWMRRFREPAAELLAIDRELLVRREVEIANDVKGALVDPPEHLIERIGPAPDPQADERAQWDGLARRHMRAHLMAERGAGTDRDGLTSREERDLRADVQRWRTARNLDEPARDADRGR